MTYLEYQFDAADRTVAAYRIMVLADKLMTTDDPEEIVEFEEAIAENYDKFEEFCEGLLKRANELESTVVSIDVEIDRLQALKAQRNARAQRFRDTVTRYMSTVGASEIVTDLFTIRLRKNPPAVEVEHEALVPAEYRVIKVVEKETIDKKAIADALKNGIPVDGCKLIIRNRLEVK